MTKTFKLALMSSVTAGLMFAGSAHATDGMFSNGYGNAAKGMAGAGTVLSQDTQAAINNPAAMLGVGNRVDVGASIFSPRRSATVETSTGVPGGFFQQAGKFESGSEYFLIPSMGVNFDYGDYSLGITMTGQGGMNTDYKECFFANSTCPDGTGIDLAQALLGFTYARKMSDNVTIGITPQLAGQRFEAKGLSGFGGVSQNSRRLTDNGYDYSWGYGASVGMLVKPSDKVSFGVTYKSRTYMTEFDQYAGLFAEAGDFDIPAALTIGTAYKYDDKLTLVADLKRIFYSTVRSMSNTNNQNAQGGPARLGTKTGLGFGWQDMTVLKLGAQYAYDDALTFRGGFSWNTMAMEDDENMFNILAPAVPQMHLSGGMTYKFGGGHELGAALTHAFNNKTTNDNNVNHSTNSIDLQMNQWELDVGYTYHF